MSKTSTKSPGMKRIIAAVIAAPGIIPNHIAKVAHVSPKSARAYVRALEEEGAIHHSHWIADPKIKGMYRRGFSVGPATGPAPTHPEGARNKGNPGAKARGDVPDDSRMPEYAVMLGALMGRKLPLERPCYEQR